MSISRFIIVISLIALFESLVFSSVTPLLPSLRDELQLSKSQAGLIVASYSIGWAVGALPMGRLALSMGIKRSVMTGLATFAIGGFAFGIVESYFGLLAIRFAQGLSGVLCWLSALTWLILVGPQKRRGATLGFFWAANAAGTLVGPAVGSLAVYLGRTAVFTALASSMIAVLFLLVSIPPPQRSIRGFHVSNRAALASHDSLIGLWLVYLASLLLGTIFVLAPLQFDDLGWGSGAIAGTFLSAAFIGVIARPITGQWADRRGRLNVAQLLVLALGPVTLIVPWVNEPRALFVAVVLATCGYGLLWAPAMAVVSQAFDQVGAAQAIGFAVMALVIGGGFVTGAAAGGGLAQAGGDVAAYSLAGAMCIATFLVLARRDSSA